MKKETSISIVWLVCAISWISFFICAWLAILEKIASEQRLWILVFLAIGCLSGLILHGQNTDVSKK